MRHIGDKPWIKSNGYPSQIYLKCDECGEMYDVLWPFGCLGGGVKMLDNYGDVLTVEEAREILKMSKNSIYRAVRSGFIPSMRVGPRLIRISKETIRRIINGEGDLNAAIKG